MRKKRIRLNNETPFDIINVVFMLLLMLLILYPLWYVLIISFNEGRDAARGGIYFWPRMFSTANYLAVFKNGKILQGFFISGSRAIIGTFAAVSFTGMVGYALGHSHLMGRRFYMTLGIITMFFSGGLIPYYMLIRNLGLRNTFWVYIIPAMFNFYNMLIMMTFFRSLPKEMSESAQIDGAGYIGIFFRIVLPLSMPIIATMALFNGVYHWNDYFVAVLYIDSEKLLPIQTILFKIVAESSAANMLTQINLPDVVAQRQITSESVKMATMVITTAPIVMVYPFLQKYFVKGIMIGSIKG
ncbi:MAG: carbohydrate ABC transporter permease [Clostridiales bacterium]|nr:carbohydrate ABC transporter permease [Clostridiales bacterium]